MESTRYAELWDDAAREFMPDYPGHQYDPHDWDVLVAGGVDYEWLSQRIKRRQDELFLASLEVA